MTLVVAATMPSKALNPLRRPIRFPQPSVVLLSDSRFSFGACKKADDGFKLWPLSDSAMAGFSGDVEVAEAAIVSLRLTIEEHRWSVPEAIAEAASTWLLYWGECIASHRVVHTTHVLIAAYNRQRKRPYLYRLFSHDGYAPARRSGVECIGSGAEQFRKEFDKKIDKATHGWAEPCRIREELGHTVGIGADGKPVWIPLERNFLEDIPPIEVVEPLSEVADTLARDEALKDVGGLLQIVILSEHGLTPIKQQKRSGSSGEWSALTAAKLRSLSEMIGRKYIIPRMSADGSLII